MKIAITGHSAGIGKALAKQYESRGHEIIGLSKRYGDDIRNVPKMLHKIKECDWFINNAYESSFQTELLFGVYAYWKGKKGKRIINISTQMTQTPSSPLPGLDMDLYRVHKVGLEEAHKQLLGNYDWPKLVMVRPGAVSTESKPDSGADANEWAEKIVHILEDMGSNLEVYDVTLGINHG